MRVAGGSCRVCAPIIPNHYVSGYPKLHAKEGVKQIGEQKYRPWWARPGADRFRIWKHKRDGAGTSVLRGLSAGAYFGGNQHGRHGGGAVVELKDMAEPDLSWTMGLCRAMADAAAQYIGCADGEKPGVCAVMCQRCQKENAGHLEPICTGKKTCTRF